MRKFIVLFCIVSLLVLVSLSSLADNKVLDIVWANESSVESEVFHQIIDEYEEMNPDIKINLIVVPFSELDNKITTMTIGGEAPDIARMSNINKLSPLLLDLNDYLGEDGKKDLYDNFLETNRVWAYQNGRQVAIPIDVTAHGLFYNKDYFEEAGVEVPTKPSDLEDLWTWDEFEAALRKVIDNSKAKYGLVVDASPYRWGTLLYQAGGKFANEDWSEMSVESPEGERAISYFVGLHDKGIMPKSVWLGGENASTLFRSGLVAAHLGVNVMISDYQENIENFNWGVAYMPREERRSSVPGGKYIASFKDATYPEEAVDFIKYFTSKEVNTKFCQATLTMSPRLDAEVDYGTASDYMDIFVNELKVTSSDPVNDWSSNAVLGSIYSDIKRVVVGAVNHDWTAKEAAQLLDRVGNEYIEKLK